MCHADGTLPPSPGGEVPDSAAVGGTATHLRSADGTEFMAYQADAVAVGADTGAGPGPGVGPGAGAGAGTGLSGPAVIVLPDMRGMHEFYKDMARKLAAAGVSALAIDYYGRDLPDDERAGPPETMMPLVMSLSAEQVAADVRAATDAVLARGATSVFCVGFCFGGSQAWNQSAFDSRLAGCVGLYGRPDDCRPFLSRMSVPLLLLVGGKDFMTPAEDFSHFDDELAQAGVEHNMVMYPNAPHAFFENSAGYDAECADAWQRLLAFIADHADHADGVGRAGRHAADQEDAKG